MRAAVMNNLVMASGWNRRNLIPDIQAYEIARFHGSTMSEPGASPVLNPPWEEARGTANTTFGGAEKRSGDAMGERGVAANAVARHLHDAIERVREDMAKGEFWADAVSGFAEQVTDSEPKGVNCEAPPERARRNSQSNQPPQKQPVSSKGKGL